MVLFLFEDTKNTAGLWISIKIECALKPKKRQEYMQDYLCFQLWSLPSVKLSQQVPGKDYNLNAPAGILPAPCPQATPGAAGSTLLSLLWVRSLLTAGLCGFSGLRRSVGCMAVMVRSLRLTFVSLFSANKWQDVCFPVVAGDAEG